MGLSFALELAKHRTSVRFQNFGAISAMVCRNFVGMACLILVVLYMYGGDMLMRLRPFLWLLYQALSG